ncbi:GAF and ANTAR domain-containing protein [Actinoplanes awajinensis]|nr:GAF and ANTAR domain-containing protein [Actinoplanes awajinensis]
MRDSALPLVAQIGWHPMTSDTAGQPRWLAEFQELLLTTGTLQQFLQEAATRTVAAMAGVSCGITVRTTVEQYTIASSDAYASGIDQIQYHHGEGPCLDAITTGVIHPIPDLARETRWPRFTAAALARGVRSSLSLPVGGTDPVGAINLYARSPRAFAAGQRAQAIAFTSTITGAITLAIQLAQQQQLSADLLQALETRAVIDQAIGVLMARQRCTPAEALRILRRASQDRNVKLRAIAATIVTGISGTPPANARFHPR